MLQYEIYSPVSSKKPTQQNSEHCTKLRNKVHNVLHNKINEKLIFLCALVL